MIFIVERHSQTASYLVSTMTQLLMPGLTRRTIVSVCLAFALLALPLAGTLHCETGHADEHAPVPLAEACCVVLCLAVIVSLLVIQSKWLSIMHGALELKPVRLSNRLTRWVPPPRPIALLR
ncbi:MAG: hypothetical protein HY870_02755 [Chloroflexi bacterium]|nr:hypothetical protein [Chloroflexota bacterium]